MKLTLNINLPPSDESFQRQLAGHEFKLGRNPDADVCLDNETVSWEHARIDARSDGVFLSDLGSSNGTFVNDRRIDGETKIEPHDQISLGQKGPRLKITHMEAGSMRIETPKQPAGPLGFAGDAFENPNPVAAAAAAASSGGAFGGNGNAPTAPPLPKPVAADAAPPALPAASPPPPHRAAKPAKPAPAGEPQRSSTRALLVNFQQSQKMWRYLAIFGGVCVLITGGVVFALFGGRLSKVNENTEVAQKDADDAQKQADQARKDADRAKHDLRDAERKLGQRLDKVGGLNADAIFKNYGESVFLVRWTDRKFVHYGTAFAIDAKGVFGTNAHVAGPLADAFRTNQVKSAELISRGGTRRFRITKALAHPRYRARSLSGFTPDVGLLRAVIPSGERLVPCPLASSADLKALGAGAALCYIGFPKYDRADYATARKTAPRIYRGTAVRMLTLAKETGAHADSQLMEHDMFSWGGASGSPIFNRTGKVVGLHFAGVSVNSQKQLASVKFAMRVDLLRELIGKL